MDFQQLFDFLYNTLNWILNILIWCINLLGKIIQWIFSLF